MIDVFYPLQRFGRIITRRHLIGSMPPKESLSSGCVLLYVQDIPELLDRLPLQPPYRAETEYDLDISRKKISKRKDDKAKIAIKSGRNFFIKLTIDN